MKYMKPEMEIIEFSRIDTIKESDGFNNGGGNSTVTEPDIDVFG